MNRRSELDGLRGVAIALVVAYHAGYLPGGAIGVSLFFALSGYLITGNLAAELAETGGVQMRRFYRHRFARLAPALLVALAGLVLMSRALGLQSGHQLSVGLLLVVGYAGNVGLGLLPGTWVPEWSWSLSLEEQFYLLWPAVLCVLWRRVGARRLAFGLITAAAGVALARMVVTASAPAAGYFLVRGDEILLGCAASLLAWRAGRWAAAAALGAVVLLAFSPLEKVSLVMAVASVACVVAVAGADGLRGVLAWRPLVHVGKISYALYLWHGVLREPVAAAMGTSAARMPLGPLVVWLAASLLTAEASTWLVERPAKRALLRKRSVALPEPAVAAVAA